MMKQDERQKQMELAISRDRLHLFLQRLSLIKAYRRLSS